MSIRRWEIVVNVDLAGPRAPRPGGDAAAIASMFGLAGKAELLYEDFRLAVSAGEVVAVVGPSGAGKSCLLRAIASAVLEAVTLDLAAVADDDRPAIACLDDDASWQRLLERLCTGRDGPPRRHDACPLGERMEILSRCGLAEASAMLTPGRMLSGGQAYRLALARAIWLAARAQQPRLLLADEFAAVLDDATAGVLAAQAGKLAVRYALGMIISTPRAELAAALRPARTVVRPLSSAGVRGGPRRARAGGWCAARSSITARLVAFTTSRAPRPLTSVSGPSACRAPTARLAGRRSPPCSSSRRRSYAAAGGTSPPTGDTSDATAAAESDASTPRSSASPAWSSTPSTAAAAWPCGSSAPPSAARQRRWSRPWPQWAPSTHSSNSRA